MNLCEIFMVTGTMSATYLIMTKNPTSENHSGIHPQGI